MNTPSPLTPSQETIRGTGNHDTVRSKPFSTGNTTVMSATRLSQTK